MPPVRLSNRPLHRLTEVLSVDPDELQTIRIGINQRTDEGRMILRHFVFAISDSDFPIDTRANADMRRAFSSGAHLSTLFKKFLQPLQQWLICLKH